MSLLQEVRERLEVCGHEMLGMNRQCRVVDIEQRGTALIVTLSADAEMRVVVKQVPTDEHSARASDVFANHCKLKLIRPLGNFLPDFLGFDDELGILLVEFVEGVPLSQHIESRVSHRSVPKLERQLESLGEIAAQFCELNIDEYVVASDPKPNKSFYAYVESAWEKYDLRHFLPKGWATPRPIMDYLDGQFLESSPRSLILLDFQPKNVLVQNGNLKLIDIHYCSASPAMFLSYFLSSIDCCSIRRPWGALGKLPTRWKNSYLRGYRRVARTEYVLDMILFYPWTLIRYIDRYTAQHPRLRMYVIFYFAMHLRRFLAKLEKCHCGAHDLWKAF